MAKREREQSPIYEREGVDKGRVVSPEIAYDMARAENRFKRVPIIGGLLSRIAHKMVERQVERGKMVEIKDLPEEIGNYISENMSDSLRQRGRFKIEGVKKVGYGGGKEAYLVSGTLTSTNFSLGGDSTMAYSQRRKDYHTHQEREILRFDVQDGKVIPMRKHKGAVAVTLLGILGGLFFISSGITGNVIGSLNQTSSNWVGAVLFIIGLVGAFAYFKRR